jgi:hypothetical protein
MLYTVEVDNRSLTLIEKSRRPIITVTIYLNVSLIAACLQIISNLRII